MLGLGWLTLSLIRRPSKFICQINLAFHHGGHFKSELLFFVSTGPLISFNAVLLLPYVVKESGAIIS